MNEENVCSRNSEGDDLEDVNEEDLEDEAVKTSDEEEDFEDPPRGGRGG